MCGIIGYIGQKQAYPITIDSLKKLEYRGYDSAGVAFINENKFIIYKKAGKVDVLEKFVSTKNINANIGLGHTRWATHGEVNDINAHPHISNNGNLVIVHNGIIENYLELKNELIKNGYSFNTDTDTEVLINYIEYIYQINSFELSDAVEEALKNIEGKYAFIILSKNDPELLIAARKGAPLAIGIGENEFYIVSDVIPIVGYTQKVTFLEDGQIAIIKDKKLKIKSFVNGKNIPVNIKDINFIPESIEKGNYEYYMLKEIYEQPLAIKNCLKGKIIHNKLILDSVEHVSDKILNAKRIIILACGSSLNAALYGKYIIEDLCRIPVIVEQASEFRYRNPVIYKEDIVIGITQSGETTDTLSALELVKSLKAFTIGICNVPNSSITRIVDAIIFTNAGPEISVASTKAIVTQMVTLSIFAMWILQKRDNRDSQKTITSFIKDINELEDKFNEVLQLEKSIKDIALWLSKYENALFLGRNYSYPVAIEGALKLKEVSYIHAESYPAAEMKHGPIALIDQNMPIVYIAANDSLNKKNLSNIEEIKARKGKILAIISEDEKNIKEMSDHYICLPNINPILMPILSMVPLQLLAYYTAKARGCDIDMPKNLAKSVTVE